MVSLYVVARTTDTMNPPSAYVSRAAALASTLTIGDPSGLVTVFPSVVVLSELFVTQLIPDDTGQATLAEVQAAQTNAATAESAQVAAQKAVATYLSSVAATIAAAQAQITADMTTLTASADPLAPIIERNLTRLVYIANMVMHLAALTSDAVNVETIPVLS